METIRAQWDELLAAEPSDWSHLDLELRLDDDERTEEVVVLLAPLNPWRRDDDYRSGILQFRAARSTGYGAAAVLVGARVSLLDDRRHRRDALGCCARSTPCGSCTPRDLANRRGRFGPSRAILHNVRAFLRIDGDDFALRGARLVWYQARCEDAEGIAFQLVTHGSKNLLHVAGWAPGSRPSTCPAPR